MNTLRAMSFFVLLLLVTTKASAQEERQDKLTFYGFFDFQAAASNERGGAQSSFRQHHVNLVSVYQLDNRWRVFTEIEYENGPQLEAGKPSSGLVVLERAVLEYQRSRALEVRMGKFLTPFGLDNERHDVSPSILSTVLPSSIYSEDRLNTLGDRQELYAKFATGMQVLGTLTRNGWDADYAAYVSNGRGPSPSEQDNNANKGVGGRFAIRSPGEAVQIGTSFYTERNGDVANTRQQSLGFDVRAQYLAVLLEAEALLPRLENVNTAGFPNGTFRKPLGYYLQLSRPFSDAVTPFARFDSFDNDVSVSGDRESEITAGLNIAATRTIFFKSEVHFRRFQDPTRQNSQLYLGSVAVAF